MPDLLDSLNRVQYAGFDFDTWLDELLARIQTRQGSAVLNDFSQSSLGVVLLDAQAYGLDALAFYLDRRASEGYLSTARTRDAITKLSRQLGYKVGSRVASSVDLQVSLTQAYAFAVTIPAGFKFKNSVENIVFESAQAVTFAPAETGPKTIPAYEGETVTETFAATGGANQEYELRRVPAGRGIARGRSSVLVDGALWFERDFLSFEQTDHYELATEQAPPVVRFGDGVVGNVPATGVSIVVTYVVTRGSLGRVGSGTIDDVVSPLVVSFQRIALLVNNPESATGGDDEESLEKVKSYAGRVFKSRTVAVTQGDYEARATTFADPLGGRVAVAQAFVSRRVADDLTLEGYLRDIRDAVAAPQTPVTDAVAAARTALATIEASLTEIATLTGTIQTENTQSDTDLAAAVISAQTAKNSAVEVAADVSEIGVAQSSADAAVTAVIADIDVIGGGAGNDQLTTATYDSLRLDLSTVQNALAKISAEVTLISGQVSTLQSALTAQLTTMRAVRDRLDAIGLAVLDTTDVLQLVEDERARIVTEVGDATTPSGIYEDLADIETAIDGLATSTDDSTAAIEEHVDGILADDCAANLITVPILTQDNAGFYTGPSVRLLQELQASLDARKEVTQVVRVVSGEPFLVLAVVTGRVRVATGFSETLVRTAVTAALDGVLRSRRFGASLYVQELYEAVRAIVGISFANFVIAGELVGAGVDASRLDGDGNLLILGGEIVTKGSVTVTTEVG